MSLSRPTLEHVEDLLERSSNLIEAGQPTAALALATLAGVSLELARANQEYAEAALEKRVAEGVGGAARGGQLRLALGV